jgi:hypothetical protein
VIERLNHLEGLSVPTHQEDAHVEHRVDVVRHQRYQRLVVLQRSNRVAAIEQL